MLRLLDGRRRIGLAEHEGDVFRVLATYGEQIAPSPQYAHANFKQKNTRIHTHTNKHTGTRVDTHSDTQKLTRTHINTHTHSQLI